MVIASIWLPHWVTYSVTTSSGETFEKHIGLHKSCSNLDDPECREFPYDEICRAGERYFCSMWRTVGFMASFAVILCLASLVSFVVIMSGGRYKRETGWPFVTAMLVLSAAVEFVIISIVVGYGSCMVLDQLANRCRRISSTTTTSLLFLAGILMSLGSLPSSAPSSVYYRLPGSPRRLTSYHPRTDTTSSTTRLTLDLDYLRGGARPRPNETDAMQTRNHGIFTKVS